MSNVDIQHDPCPQCGLRPGPYKVLFGWMPCLCGGHKTRYCRPGAGGCGYEMWEPSKGEDCRDPRQGY